MLLHFQEDSIAFIAEKTEYAVTVLMNLLSWRIIKSFKTMATQPKKMNIIKQVLTGHKNGLSVRKMAEMYSMSPTTV